VVAVDALAAAAAAFGLEVVEADRELGVLGRSAGNGVTCLRAAANLAPLAGARATRSSTAQLPSKRRHTTDDRTLRIAQIRRSATARISCSVKFSTPAT
jgi:hypothetical protein